MILTVRNHRAWKGDDVVALTEYRIITEKNVPVRMPDGTVLRTDVYRPDVYGRVPVLVERLPYSKEGLPLVAFTVDPLRAAGAGYAVIVQDTRGRYQSEGRFYPFVHEAEDGSATVTWAAHQTWSNGKVGMIGGSYFGATQWLAATRNPEGLAAIAPAVTAADYHEGWAYQGGAFELGFNLYWTLLFLAPDTLQRLVAAGEVESSQLDQLLGYLVPGRLDEALRRMPLLDFPELQKAAPYYFDWLRHPARDEYWKTLAPIEHHHEITVPSLNIGGWYDLFLGGTLANYTGMRQHGAAPEARRPHLLVAPWAHGAMSGSFAEYDFGLAAGADGIDLTGIHLRWFDHWLKGEANGVDQEDPVRIFVMGINQWKTAKDWPLPHTQYRSFFLHSRGHANTASGDGALSQDPPGNAEPADVYLYDPRNPVPTVGGPTFLPGLFIGANAGPRDQRRVEERSDVLCYSSDVLTEPLEVTGPVEAVLYVSSSARDTDFTVKLCDVYPDGRVFNLTEGILRCRYRESMEEERLMEPERIYEIHVDVWATSNVFLPGHRIRVEVSSSNFPRFDRNTNTGGVIAEEQESECVQAVNRIHHTSAHPSHIVLPVIEP